MSKLIEIWKNVPFKEYENYYKVSNLGRVKSIKRNNILNILAEFL